MKRSRNKMKRSRNKMKELYHNNLLKIELNTETMFRQCSNTTQTIFKNNSTIFD